MPGLSSSDAWLLALADPEGVRQKLPSQRLSQDACKSLLARADVHGVLPAVLMNLKGLIQRRGTEQVVAGRVDSKSSLLALFEHARSQLRQQTAATLLLRHRADEALAALHDAGIPAVLIKGSDIADRLYPHAGLRLFRDIDILTPRPRFAEAERVLAKLGYRPRAEDVGKVEQDYGERGWQHVKNPQCVVELHWDVVNCPSQRRASSLGYDDLQFEPVPGGGPLEVRLSPASMLLLMALHAAIGHRFDRLQLLVDLCQASRGRAGSIDEDWLRSTMRQTGGATSLAMGLHLAERLIGESACGDLRRRLGLRDVGPVGRLLLRRSTVLQSASTVGKLQRTGIRELLKRAA
jgi:putative nucleotidyltransferase-like protein